MSVVSGSGADIAFMVMSCSVVRRRMDARQGAGFATADDYCQLNAERIGTGEVLVTSYAFLRGAWLWWQCARLL